MTPKCLTRVRLTYSPVVTTGLVNAIATPILLYRHFFTHADRHHPIGLIVYALFLLFIFYKGFRLKLRVADLVESAALKCGLGRAKPRARAEGTVESPTAQGSAADQAGTPVSETVTSVSPQPDASSGAR